MISNSFDPASPALNQKGEKGRMACTIANAAASNELMRSSNELMEYQPLCQVIQVEKDAHLMTDVGQNSGTTVMRTVSKGRQSKIKDKQTEFSKATTSTEVLPMRARAILPAGHRTDLTGPTTNIISADVLLVDPIVYSLGVFGATCCANTQLYASLCML